MLRHGNGSTAMLMPFSKCVPGWICALSGQSRTVISSLVFITEVDEAFAELEDGNEVH